jgi:hypothetical protein
MVAVGVGVDHGADPLGRRGRLAQGGEHLGGQLQVKQGVDQQRGSPVAAGDEPGVGAAPPPVGL